jgi:integrase
VGRRALVPTPFRDAEHGDVYQFRFTVHGARYRGSTGCRDYGAAQSFIDAIYAGALKGKKPPKRERRYGGALAQAPLVELFSTFILSLQSKKSASYIEKMESHFRAHFSHRWASLDAMLEPGAVDKYASDRLSGAAPAVEEKKTRNRPAEGSSVTVAKELVTLRRFLKWCRKHGHVEHIPEWEPVAPISDYAPPDYSPDDVRALLAALPDRKAHRRRYPVREFFTIQWAQALRPGELESLRWQDVNLKRQEMTVRQSEDKARIGRVLQLVPDAIAVLEKMEVGAGLIFGRVSFQRSLDIATKEVGLPRVTPHHFRHFRLTELGHLPTATPGALRSFAGHKHLATTDRYIRSQARAMRAMLAGLNTDPVVTQSAPPRGENLPRRAEKKNVTTRKHGKR